MLNQIADGVYAIEQSLHVVAGFTIPARMTIVRDPEGQLWLHSPIEINEALAAEIDALGCVRWLVAPNCLHHLFFESACTRWPNAKRVATPGLAKKRSDLSFDYQLPEQGTFEPWADWMQSCFIAGAPSMGETVFLHRPTASLICTDLLFNLPNQAHNATSWLLLSLAGVRGRFARCRSWYLFTKDRKALKASIAKVLAWDIERVIPAHGAVLEKDAETQVRSALT